MSWFSLQIMLDFARISIEKVANSLPEGLLIALLAWLLLRALGRQNAGTRFAVWMTVLIAVAALPFAGSFSFSFISAHLPMEPHITLPLYWIVPLSALWITGTGIAIARIIVGLLQVRAIRKNSTVVDPAQLDAVVQESLRAAQLESGVRREVILASSNRVRVPAAIGFLKPMIVFPSWTLRELSPDELKVILIHELAHVHRRDDWTNLLQKLVRAVFFFHPAVWWIDARLSVEREMACDDAVLAETGNPRAYANCLVDLLEKSCARRGWSMAQAAVHRAREASLRIARILDARRPATTRIWKIAPGLAGVFSLACAGLLLWMPRMVAFLPDSTVATETPVRPSAYELQPPIVIPASFPVRSAEVKTAAAESAAHSPSQTAAHPAVAQHSHKPTGIAAEAVMTKSVRQRHPAASMMVLVETTEIESQPMLPTELIQYLPEPMQPADIPSRWSIQVWHLVLVSPAQAEVQGSAI